MRHKETEKQIIISIYFSVDEMMTSAFIKSALGSLCLYVNEYMNSCQKFNLISKYVDTLFRYFTGILCRTSPFIFSILDYGGIKFSG